jgi:hypothetical protein
MDQRSHQQPRRHPEVRRAHGRGGRRYQGHSVQWRRVHARRARQACADVGAGKPRGVCCSVCRCTIAPTGSARYASRSCVKWSSQSAAFPSSWTYSCKFLRTYAEVPVVLTNRDMASRPSNFTYTPSVFWRYLRYPLLAFWACAPLRCDETLHSDDHVHTHDVSGATGRHPWSTGSGRLRARSRSSARRRTLARSAPRSAPRGRGPRPACDRPRCE